MLDAGTPSLWSESKILSPTRFFCISLNGGAWMVTMAIGVSAVKPVVRQRKMLHHFVGSVRVIVRYAEAIHRDIQTPKADVHARLGESLWVETILELTQKDKVELLVGARFAAPPRPSQKEEGKPATTVAVVRFPQVWAFPVSLYR
jgi:hypothetical protein